MNHPKNHFCISSSRAGVLIRWFLGANVYLALFSCLKLSASVCAWGQSLTETLSVKYQPLISSVYKVYMCTVCTPCTEALASDRTSAADKPALVVQH